ncbi:hypothetical protein U6A24_13835 [Aquimarina gracilis]|uniref:Outer membrane protein beta-barrel domain-containing protein n=1 Tax=Aquimarina gracilis TaxID=874422 RepID=A0ABU5ZXE9_9FLAO|nr:hypothetical protein [Aquimarina gracilis]MEB3346554.1 hypothetical protein [Aquimarina gracilis]
MKKLMLTALAVVSFTFANAQDGDTGQTAKGKWLIEANTSFGAPGNGNTAFGLRSRDGETDWGLGLEGGYFVMDDLAIKAGLGYADSSEEGALSTFTYKIGAKYYIMSKIPVELSYAGLSIEDADENPSYLGIQAGYAWFLGDNVSIEPGLRYNATLNEDADAESNLQFNVGFALHF